MNKRRGDGACEPGVACHAGIGEGTEKKYEFVFLPVADDHAFGKQAVQGRRCDDSVAVVIDHRTNREETAVVHVRKGKHHVPQAGYFKFQ